MLGSRSAYTRAQILDTAGRLFARKGHENTSLREITAAAGVNLSSVNYHFGSKEGLIKAVFQEQLATLNRERLSLLDQLESEANGSPVQASDIVDAFFRPLIRIALSPEERPIPLPSLRGLSDPAGFFHTFIIEEDAGIAERYQAALLKALPTLPEQEVLWRFQFMLGATAYAVSGMDGLRLALNRDAYAPVDVAELTRRLIAFLTGGLVAQGSYPEPQQSG